MLTTVRGALVDLPGLIIAPIRVTSLNLYRVGETAREIFDDATGSLATDSEIRCVLRRVELRLLLKVHVNGVLILT